MYVRVTALQFGPVWSILVACGLEQFVQSGYPSDPLHTDTVHLPLSVLTEQELDPFTPHPLYVNDTGQVFVGVDGVGHDQLFSQYGGV